MTELARFPDFYAPTPAMDTDFYYFLAEMMRLNSPLVTAEPYYYFPAFAWYMRAVTALFGENPYAPRIISILLGSTAPIGIFLMAKRILGSRYPSPSPSPTRGEGIGEKAAYVALFLSSFYGMFIFYDNQVLKTTFEIFFITWGLYFLIVGVTYSPLSMSSPLVGNPSEERLRSSRSDNGKGGGARYFLASGLFFALSTATHTSVMLSALGLAAYLAFKKEIKSAALFIAPAVIVLALMGARNYSVPSFGSGEFTSVAVGGIHLYGGNSANATGVYKNIPGIRPNAFMYLDAKELAEKESGVKGVSPSKYFGAKAVKWMRENPVSFVRLLSRKLLILVNGYEVPNNVDINYVGERSFFFRHMTVPFWLLAPLGLTGFLLSVRESRLTIPGIFLLTYGLAVVIFFVNDRYRLPIVIPLFVYAAYLFDRAAHGGMRTKAIAASLVVGLFFVSNLDLDLGQAGFNRSTEAKMRASAEAGRIKAEMLKAEMKKAKDPKRLSAQWARLGDLYLKTRGWEQGRYYYYKAFKADPKNEEAELMYYKLGIMGIKPVVPDE